MAIKYPRRPGSPEASSAGSVPPSPYRKRHTGASHGNNGERERAYSDDEHGNTSDEKLLPSNVAAEALLLGSILIDGGEGDALAEVAAIVQPDDFYKEAHRLIFRAMRDLAATGANVDLMTLYDELARTDMLGSIAGNGLDGMAYVSSLANKVPTFQHARDYAVIVKRLAMNRSLIQAGADVAAMGYLDADLAGALAYAQGRVEDVRHAAAALLGEGERDEHATLAELVGMDFPEPRWVVPGVLPEGLTLLGGKPKMGKSWLVLALAIALGCGGKALGSLDVEQGDVLYLALEDTLRRIKKRSVQLTAGSGPLPASVDVWTRWPRLDAGGIVKMEEWLDRHPQARLIIVDTLAKVRPDADPDSSVYTQDYHVLEGLKRLADQHHLAIVVVHHLRKMAAGDPLDEISGSTGLTGGVDNVLVMRRERGKADAVLHVTGRDIDEQELALTFDGSRGQWNLAGDASEYRSSQLQQAALDVLKEAGEPLTIAQVAEAMSSKYEQAKLALWRMEQEGVIRKATRGRYQMPGSPSSECDADISETFDTGKLCRDGDEGACDDGTRREPGLDAMHTGRSADAADIQSFAVSEVSQSTHERNPDEWSSADNDAWNEHLARREALWIWAQAHQWPAIMNALGVFIPQNQHAWTAYLRTASAVSVRTLYEQVRLGMGSDGLSAGEGSDAP